MHTKTVTEEYIFKKASDEEIENERLNSIKTLDAENQASVENWNENLYPDDEPEKFDSINHGSDTLYHYEAFHTSYVIMDTLWRNVCEHPAILANSKYYQEAYKAFEHLFNLYRMMGDDNEVLGLDIPDFARQKRIEKTIQEKYQSSEKD